MRNTVQHRIRRGTLVVFLGKGFSVLGVLLLSGVLARMLPRHDLGVFFLTSSFVSFMAIICQLGLNQSVVRDIAQALGLGRNDVARSVAYTSLLYAIAAILVVILLLSSGVLNLIWGVLLKDGSKTPLTFLLFAWIALTTLQSLQGEIFRGLHAIGRATFFGVQGGTGGTFSLAISLVLLLIFMEMGGVLTLDLSITALVIGQLVCVGAAWIVLSRHFHQFLHNNSANTAKYSMLTIPFSLMLTGVLFFVVGQIDLWVLGFLRSKEEIALYGAATTLVKYVSSATLLLSAVIPSTVAELYAKEKKQELEEILRATAFIGTLIALSIALLFWVFGAQMLSLIFGHNYTEAAPVLAILAIGHIVNAFTGNCGVVLVMTGKDRVILTITLISGVLTAVLDFLLAEYYGLIGVAIGSALGLAGMNVSMWLSARYYLKIWTHAKFSIAPLRLWSVQRAMKPNE